MLKAQVSYSKKVPVPDSEYSSQGYSLTLETEITETEAMAIQARLHSTFELVKHSVEQELANGKTSNGKPVAHPAEPFPGPMGNGNNGSAEKASNRQVKYITDLAREQGLSISELTAQCQQLYGAKNIYDLSKKQASALVESLRQPRRKAA